MLKFDKHDNFEVVAHDEAGIICRVRAPLGNTERLHWLNGQEFEHGEHIYIVTEASADSEGSILFHAALSFKDKLLHDVRERVANRIQVGSVNDGVRNAILVASDESTKALIDALFDLVGERGMMLEKAMAPSRLAKSLQELTTKSG